MKEIRSIFDVNSKLLIHVLYYTIMARKTRPITITIPEDKIQTLKTEAERLGLSLSKYLVLAAITFRVEDIKGEKR